MAAWVIEQYDGVYDEFYKQCSDDRELQRSIVKRVGQLLEYGDKLTFPACRHLDDGIYELRPKSAKHHARLLYYLEPEQHAMIVVAFLKDQRAVEKKHIDKAKRIRATLQSEKELASGSSHKH